MPPRAAVRRLEEELRHKQQLMEEAAAREKDRRKRDKMAGGKPKLSFAEEVRAIGRGQENERAWELGTTGNEVY